MTNSGPISQIEAALLRGESVSAIAALEGVSRREIDACRKAFFDKLRSDPREVLALADAGILNACELNRATDRTRRKKSKVEQVEMFAVSALGVRQKQSPA